MSETANHARKGCRSPKESLPTPFHTQLALSMLQALQLFCLACFILRPGARVERTLRAGSRAIFRRKHTKPCEAWRLQWSDKERLTDFWLPPRCQKVLRSLWRRQMVASSQDDIMVKLFVSDLSAHTNLTGGYIQMIFGIVV